MTLLELAPTGEQLELLRFRGRVASTPQPLLPL